MGFAAVRRCHSISAYTIFSSFGGAYLRRLPIIRKLQQMQHIRMLLLNNPQPTLLRHALQRATKRLMPHLPSHSLKHRIRIRNRSQLKLRRMRESMSFFCEDSGSYGLLLGVVLPFYVASPTRDLFREDFIRIDVTTRCRVAGVDGAVLIVVGAFQVIADQIGFGVVGERLVDKLELGGVKALLEFPFICPLLEFSK